MSLTAKERKSFLEIFNKIRCGIIKQGKSGVSRL